MKTKIKILTAIMLLTSVLTAADTGAGKVAYDRACKSCHGLDGAPNEKIAAAMKVEMRPLGSKEVQGLSDAALKTVITEGRGKMKPIKSVSGADVDNVV